MKKIIFEIFFLITFFFLIVSCSNKTAVSEPEPDDDSGINDSYIPNDDDSEPDDELKEPPVFKSGFIEIEPVNYIYDNKEYSAGSTRMWYNFQPADEYPEDKPIFVFFNGGPGSSSTLLFAYNTSKMTGDQAFSEENIVENEYSWTQMGNLLYIDARQTGFSYGMVDTPENEEARKQEYSHSSFNVYIDAADFIRVILRVLSENPSIMSNPVILAGESYGGTRATAMLNILLNIRDYASGNRKFRDTELFDEIDAHYTKIYPEISELPDKELIKKQFSRQILIQPLIAGQDQFDHSGLILETPPGPIYEIEAETGIEFNPCNPYDPRCSPHNNALMYAQKAGRDMYCYTKEYNWLFEYVAVASEKITDIELMEKLMQNDPRNADWMYAENREKAFRHSETTATYSTLSRFASISIPESIETEILYNEQYYKLLKSGNLEEVFGELKIYDDYYISLNSIVTRLFYFFDFTPYSKGNGDMFLENIKDVRTFITNAEEDIVIYSPGIPPSLTEYDTVENVIESDEEFTVKFKDGREITVTFPFYLGSSHSVSVNQPEKFYQDVKDWLE